MQKHRDPDSKRPHFLYFRSYVIEDGSPYMRSGKQNMSSTSRQGGKAVPRDMVDDLGDDMWNFMSFCKKDFVKDSIPDQQLGLQELIIRYKGEFRMSITKQSVFKLNFLVFFFK